MKRALTRKETKIGRRSCNLKSAVQVQLGTTQPRLMMSTSKLYTDTCMHMFVYGFVSAQEHTYSRTEAIRKTVLLIPDGQLMLIIPIMFACVMFVP